YDEGSEAARRHSKQVDMICNTLEQWAIRDVGNRPHKLFLHFFEAPSEVLGEDGRVVGLRTERTRLDGAGNCSGTGVFRDWDVQSVYRAVGYLSRPITGLPFDDDAGVVPNEAGRVLLEGRAQGPDRHLPGVYVTGWIKRGPVGLIGHTKGDANETVACLLDDLPWLCRESRPGPSEVTRWLADRNVPFTTWDGWYRLDAHERALGAPQGRERVKVVERADMLQASR
ncbi:pyridine nucleotide-disulfide oxidoreductase, partial [Nocardia sp. NPDC003693]